MRTPVKSESSIYDPHFHRVSHQRSSALVGKARCTTCKRSRGTGKAPGTLETLSRPHLTSYCEMRRPTTSLQTKSMPLDAPMETEKWNALGFHPTFKTDRGLWVMERAYPSRGCVPGARHIEFWEAVKIACTSLGKSIPQGFRLHTDP